MKHAFLALMMILLMLELPFFVAAESGIADYGVVGQDNVKNAVRQNDAVTVSALVSVDGDAQITPDQLWLGLGTPFTSCAPDLSGKFRCTVRFPASGSYTFSNQNNFNIKR